MNGNPDTARVLQDAAEWLMALPEPSHMQLAAAGELLLEAARVVRGQVILAETITAAPNVRAGLWRPRPAGQPDTLDRMYEQIARDNGGTLAGQYAADPAGADVSRETCGRTEHDYGCCPLAVTGYAGEASHPYRLQPTPEMAEYLRQYPAGPDRPANAPTYAEWGQAREVSNASDTGR